MNKKPSYWALGYKNLRAYFSEISKIEQNEYCKIHTHCCGIWSSSEMGIIINKIINLLHFLLV